MKKALLIFFILNSLISTAQKTNSGTEFWVGFMSNINTQGHNLRLYISSSYNAKVYIRIPLQNYIDSVSIPQDSVRMVVIPYQDAEMSRIGDTIESKGIHITSDNPISVSAMNLSAASTDASIVLPLVNIPLKATYISGNPNQGTSILMVATADSTRVNINPSNTLSNFIRPSAGAYTITLNRGQAYQIKSNSDLSGSIIKVLSNSKLLVFSGAECNNWPCGACDHQYEQVLPLPVLDTAYCIPPQFGHTRGYYLKLIPLDSSTNFRINNRTVNNVSRTSPYVINVTSDSGYYIASDKPFYCYQFLKGAGCNGYITTGYGDPAMLAIVSTKHFGQSAIFSTVNSTNLRDHFVSVVIPTFAKDNVFMDGIKVDSSEFIVFPYNKDFSYAALRINLGVHTLECSDGLLAYCSGVGFYESYLYLAGFNLPNFDLTFKDSVLHYDCKNNQIKFHFKAKSGSTLKKYTWYFGDGQVGYGDPIVHTFDTFGFIPVKLVGEDFNGKKDSVTNIVRVNWPNFDPIRDKIICGYDTVTYIEKSPFFANFKWQDSSSNRFFKAWDNTKLWVKATDTSGYCKFEDSGKLSKLDIFTKITVDTVDNCYRFNQFKFKDSVRLTADTIYHKSWVFPWVTIWDKDTTTKKFPMPGKYKVYYDLYTKNANCKARYPIDIVVHPNPKAYTKTLYEDFCSNKPFLIYDSSQIVTGSIYKVKWLFDNNTEIISDSLKTYTSLTYDVADGQVIRFYRHIPYSEFSCTDTVQSALKVWPKPTVNFTLSPNDTIKCLPNARWTFTSSTKSDVDTFKLKWDAGNGTKGTANDLRNVRYNNAGKYSVKLVAISPFGCHDSITKKIEVIPSPKAGFYSPDTAQCLNNNLFELIDTSKGLYLSYKWSLDENKYSTIKNLDSILYTDTGLKTIKLVISSSIPGCTDSITKHLLVLNPPKAIIGVNQDTQCLNGNRFNLKNNSTYSQAAFSTLWKAAFTVLGNKDTLINLSFNDTGIYSIVMVSEDIEGCADTSKIDLYVASHPNSNLMVNDSIQCANINRFVFRTSDNSNAIKRWRRNQNLVQFSNTDSLVQNNLNSGFHTISLVKESAVGCSDSSIIRVRVLDKPQAEITVPDDAQCFEGHSFDIQNTSSANADLIVFREFEYNSIKYTNTDNLNGFTFDSPGIKTIKLRIETAEKCIDSITKNITVYENPEISIIGDTVCLLETMTIQGVQISGSTISNWDWTLGDGNTANTQNVQHRYNNAGTYDLQLKVIDINNCEAEETLIDGALVHILPNANFNLSTTDFGINQMKLKFIPSISSNYTYEWNFPDGSSSVIDTPSFVISEQYKGIVYLTVRNQFGCEDSSSKFISLYPNNFNVYLPNAITVNSDLLNDIFKVQGIGEVLNFEMRIFNRWGEEIFFSNDPEKGWDGSYQNEFVQDGIYTYLINFKYFDGKSYRFTGTLTVLR